MGIFLSKVYLHFCYWLSQLMPSKGIWEEFTERVLAEQAQLSNYIPRLILEGMQSHFHGVVENGFLLDSGVVWTLDQLGSEAYEGCLERYVVCYGKSWEKFFPGLREIAEGVGRNSRSLAAIRHGAAWAHVRSVEE